MQIYIDSDYKCYTEPAEGLTAVESSFFDGKCKSYINGYRFVPAGHTWTRSDGAAFDGEMVASWKDHAILEAAQQAYEESLDEMQDMQNALELLGVEPTEVENG